MGYKNVCTHCRVSFSKGMDIGEGMTASNCPGCGKLMTLVHHKFKPPKKTDTKGWKIVSLLIENGFTFNSAYQQIADNVFLKASYPKTLSEAQEFIKVYKERT